MIDRAKVILLGGANRIWLPLSNVLIAYLIILYNSPEFWGNIVYIILTIEFAISIISWGQRPYLIREFSLNPSSINRDWSNSFIYRIPILIVFLAIIPFLGFVLRLVLFLALWTIARYIYQSFEAVIQYERKFQFSLLNELTGLLLMAVPILLLRSELDLAIVVMLYSLSYTFRALVVLFYFRSMLKSLFLSRPNTVTVLRASKDHLVISFPFLLLTFSGMLQQRTDLYCVAFFLEKAEVAKYQVYLNFLAFSQLAASIILSPYARNIFRLNEPSLRKLEKSFIKLGAGLTLVLIAMVYLLIRYVYQFELSAYLYGLGFIYVWLFYFYLIPNFEYGKHRKQQLVAYYSLAGGLVNLMGSIFLTPTLELEGALIAGVISQLFMVWIFNRKRISG